MQKNYNFRLEKHFVNYKIDNISNDSSKRS